MGNVRMLKSIDWTESNENVSRGEEGSESNKKETTLHDKIQLKVMIEC